MSKILFPTDFSDTATNAFIYALHLAQATDAELYVLHCFEMPVISSTSSGQPDLVQQVYNTIELDQFEKFKNQVPKMREIASQNNLDDVELKFIFEEGLLISVLKNVIEKENIDYIVMGTTGANTIEKKILGSNVVNVMNNIDIPILCIPKEAKYYGLKTIGFATMLKESDKKGIYTIAKVAQRLGAEFKCLHILRDENSGYEEHLNKWIEEFSPLGITFHTVLNRDIEQSVFFFIDKYDVDVMCIVKRQMGFFESIFSASLSKKMAYHSYIPVFILREEKGE